MEVVEGALLCSGLKSAPTGPEPEDVTEVDAALGNNGFGGCPPNTEGPTCGPNGTTGLLVGILGAVVLGCGILGSFPIFICGIRTILGKGGIPGIPGRGGIGIPGIGGGTNGGKFGIPGIGIPLGGIGTGGIPGNGTGGIMPCVMGAASAGVETGAEVGAG